MKIKVEQKHIESGLAENSSRCPIALGAHDSTLAYCTVAYKTICINFKEYNLPAEAIYFIRAFDNNEKVEPFEFDIST